MYLTTMHPSVVDLAAFSYNLWQQRKVKVEEARLIKFTLCVMYTRFLKYHQILTGVYKGESCPVSVLSSSAFVLIYTGRNILCTEPAWRTGGKRYNLSSGSIAIESFCTESNELKNTYICQ